MYVCVCVCVFTRKYNKLKSRFFLTSFCNSAQATHTIVCH